jgi:septal ring factor EnvC (AmiA/AmiB activator)
MGATKENILHSARQYINLLTKEEVKFQDALNTQRDKNLTGKQEEIKKLEQTIQQKEAEIEKLKSDLEEHKKQIGNLEKEINAASDKLTQTASDFEATYRALLQQIENDVKNIESHL